MKYLILISVLFLQCFLAGVDDCYEGYFSLRDDIRDGYELKEIPDMNVALGDTLWIKDKDYWKNRLDCDYGYSDFWMQFVLSNPEIVKPILLDDYIGLIPVSEGKSEIKIIGSILTRKNGEDKNIYKSLDFNVFVKKETEATSIRPEEVYSPFFSIREIKVNPLKNNKNGWMSIQIVTEPDFEVYSEKYESFQEGYYVTVMTSLEFNEQNPKQSGFYRNYAIKYFDFPWDSSSSTVYGLIEKSNPDFWNSEMESAKKKFNSSTGRFFGIRSYPLDVPLEQRMFEVFAID